MIKYSFERIRFFLNRHRVVLSIILIHCLITIPLAYILNTHYDEACSLDTTKATLFHTISRTIEFENQAPVYFLLLNIWRNLGSSYFFARLLSIIFSAASIFLSYKILEKDVKINKPGFATFLIAINPFLIRYAVEIRLYTLMVFLSALLIFYMYEIYLFENKSGKYRIIFILISLVSIHTQYYMGFFLVAIGFNILIYKGWRKFRTYLIDMIIPLLRLILVIPFIGSISRQIGTASNHMHLGTILGYLKYKIIFAYVFSLNSYLFQIFSNYEIWIFVISLIIIFLFSIKGHFKKLINILNFKEYSTIPLIIVLLLFYLLLIIKYDFSKLQIRYTAALFFPLIFTVASFIYLSSKKKFLVFWFFLFTFLYSSALIHNYSPMAKQGDWIRISKYLSANEKNNEPILIPDSTYAMPFEVHYKGHNSVITMYDKKNEKNLLKAVKVRAKYFWWVFQNPEWYTHTQDAEIAKKFISDNFDMISKRSFHLWMQVWLIKRKINNVDKN